MFRIRFVYSHPCKKRKDGAPFVRYESRRSRPKPGPPAQVILPGAGGTVTFKYDPFGRRVQKSFVQGASTTATNYVYDPESNVLEEVDQAGNLLMRYIQGKGMDEPLEEMRSGSTSYYEADGLGSVTSLSDSLGMIADTYVYDSYGKLAASTGTVINPLQYTAREFDLETGIYFYRARYYNQNIGRFLNEDSLRLKAGINFYTYVHNNPVAHKDPSGLSPACNGRCKVSCARLPPTFGAYFACTDHGLADTSCECPAARGIFVIRDQRICNVEGVFTDYCILCPVCEPYCSWFTSPKGSA